MPQTQVGASKGPLAGLPGWTRQGAAVTGPAALDPSAALTFPMTQAEMAQADVVQADVVQADVVQAKDGNLTAFHAARSVLAQGTRTLHPVTLPPAPGGHAGSPVSRGLTGRQGRVPGRALTGPPGTP